MIEWRLEDGTAGTVTTCTVSGGGADKSSSAFFRASSGDLQFHTRTRIGRTFDSLHSSQHIEVSSSTSQSGNGLLSGLGSEQKQHFGSFFARVFLFV
jgi:hypothetical protein